MPADPCTTFDPLVSDALHAALLAALSLVAIELRRARAGRSKDPTNGPVDRPPAS